MIIGVRFCEARPQREGLEPRWPFSNHDAACKQAFAETSTKFLPLPFRFHAIRKVDWGSTKCVMLIFGEDNSFLYRKLFKHVGRMGGENGLRGKRAGLMNNTLLSIGWYRCFRFLHREDNILLDLRDFRQHRQDEHIYRPPALLIKWCSVITLSCSNKCGNHLAQMLAGRSESTRLNSTPHS